jgi:hypothetical protein
VTDSQKETEQVPHLAVYQREMGAVPTKKRIGFSADVLCVQNYMVLGSSCDNMRPLNVMEGRTYHVSSQQGAFYFGTCAISQKSGWFPKSHAKLPGEVVEKEGNDDRVSVCGGK